VRELGLTRWHLVAAPEPDDIDWDSVSFPFVKRTALVLLINIMILLLLLLFTSPVAVTSAISSGTYNGKYIYIYTYYRYYIYIAKLFTLYSFSKGAAQSLSQLVDTISGFVSSFSPNMAKMMVNYIPTLILVMINAVLLNVLMYAGRFQPIATDSAKERMILRSSAICK
jgi:hypothetical protein